MKPYWQPQSERGTIRRVKYWKIIADNLSKAGWSWAVSQRLIPEVECRRASRRRKAFGRACG
jgi:hypothetical protein